jgi:hypothetical protein
MKSKYQMVIFGVLWRPQVKGSIFGVRCRELIVLWRLWYTGTCKDLQHTFYFSLVWFIQLRNPDSSFLMI